MSFVDFKEVSIGNVGPPDKYGSNQLLELMQILNGKTVALRRPRIANPWLWLSYQDITAITTPSINPSSGTIRLFADSADSDKLKYKQSNGTVIDLTTATNVITTLDGLTDVAISSPQTDQLLTYNGTTWVNAAQQFLTTLNIQKASQSSTAEVLLDAEVTDDASSYFRIINKSSTNSRFSPGIESLANAAANTERGLMIEAMIPSAQDTGTTTAVMELRSRLEAAAAIVNRPIFRISNNTTNLLSVFATYFDYHDKLIRHVLGMRIKRVSSSPATPASTYAELYFDTDNVLKLKKDTGVVIDLESGAGGGATTLDGLTDVTVAAPANRHILAYNSGATQWQNRLMETADLPSGTLSNTADNNLGAHYVNLTEVADPAQPSADNARLFLKSSTGNLSIKKSNNTIVDLEAVGSQSPFVWTQEQTSFTSNWSNGRTHPNGSTRSNGDNARTHIITENNLTITRLKVGVSSNTKNASSTFSLVDDGVTVPNTSITIPAFSTGHFSTGVISQSIGSGSQVSSNLNTGSSTSGSISYVVDTFGAYILT